MDVDVWCRRGAVLGHLARDIRSPWIGHGNDVTALTTLAVIAVAGGTLAVRRLTPSA